MSAAGFHDQMFGWLEWPAIPAIPARRCAWFEGRGHARPGFPADLASWIDNLPVAAKAS